MDGPVLWIAAAASPVVTGLAVVWLLAGPQRTEVLSGLVAVLATLGTAYALIRIEHTYVRPDAAFYAFAFAVAALGGGYALGSTLLVYLARAPRPVEPITLAPAPGAETAVIIVSCIEPPRYDVRATAGMLRSLSDEGLLEVSIAALPILFMAHKTRYRVLDGTSPALDGLVSISSRVAELLGPRYVVSWATCSGPHRLAVRCADAARAGHPRVIVAPLMVARSLHFEMAWQEAQDLFAEEHGVGLALAPTEVHLDAVAAMLADRVAAARPADARAGVVIVGHGQPEERSRAWPAFETAEITFMSRVQSELVERGLDRDLIRVAWAEWTEPTVTSEVRHLAALGCEWIAVLPAVFPVDTLATRTDLPVAIRQARLGDNVSVLLLFAWGPDPVVIGALGEAVRDAERSG